jgi:ABC-type multidrug transport system permease subunit
VQGLIAEMLSLAAFVRLMAGISGVAAVLSWRMFMRLEAIEGRGQDLSLPMTRADLAPGRRGRPLWRLARKELGLQQLSFAVAGVATMGWLAMFLFGVVTSTSRQFEDPLGAVASLDSGLLALVIGSLASAEERQLGVFEWQALLPIASWKQWAVKVAVTLGLALLLSVLLPALLLAFTGGPIRIGQRYAGVMLVLTTASLYVSSLSSSGVRALIVSLPISLFALFITVTLLMRPGGIQLTPISTGFVGAVLGLGLYFALVNHRSAERGTRRILLQVLCLTGCAVLSVVLVAVGIR